jgi:ComF family protein
MGGAWLTAWSGLRRGVGVVLDSVAPRGCAGCGTMVEPDELCATCQADLDELTARPACLKCGGPLGGDGGGLCPWCLGKGVYPFEGIVRLGTFDGPIKTLVHRMKYGRRWGIGEALADMLWEQESVRDIVAAADVIAPVPLHWWKQVGRGFNQAEVIARRLASYTRARVVRPVKRIMATESQTHFHSQKKRAENVKRAFAMRNPRLVAGKKVVLVDDVMTTGATIGTVARRLIEGGAAGVWGVVVAVADPKRRGWRAV